MRSRPPQLLCVTSRTVAPSFLARLTLVAWLRRLPRVRVHVVQGISSILKLPLERYAVVLLYFHASQVEEESLAALETYVSQGGGLVALHSAAASFEDNPAYSAILGGRFIHQGPITTFEVRPALREQGEPSVEGSGRAGSLPNGPSHQSSDLRAPGLLPSFPKMSPFTLRDELNIHEYNPDNLVHFVTDTENGREPVAWSRLHGRGRVFYLAPGHRVETLRNPSIRNILRHGIRWVAAGRGEPG